MELDRALELAVLSCWRDLVKAGDACSVRVEYKNVSGIPVDSLEVWTMRNRGYENLVCRYSVAAPGAGVAPFDVPTILFANSYRSRTLADNISFILRNQGQFTRFPDRSVHGLVQIAKPSQEDLADAANWSKSLLAESVETVWN